MLKAHLITSYYTAMHQIKPGDLPKAPRSRTWSAIRREIGDALYNETDLSLTEIGKLIGVKKFRPTTPRDRTAQVIHTDYYHKDC